VPSSRRYYTDSYTTTFTADVVEAFDLDGRPAVVLAETYFYPTSGGQPNDLGTLDESRVVDVVAREGDGAVVHVLDRPLTTRRVVGRIDWARRLDHMQQHTGQHILSQAFVRVADATTIGFHLGAEYVSIDLDVGALPDDAAREAFALANRVVTADLAVRAWFPTADQLDALQLRKTPEVDGSLRIVAIGDFDTTACGGTHVARSGEIGLIHHLKSERLKRGTRVSFLCGDRARADYAAKHAITARLAAELTCGVGELPDAVSRLQAELVAARRALAKHHDEALEREAAALRAGARATPAGTVILKAWEGRANDDLRALVLKLTSTPDTLALLGTAGPRAQFVFGRSESLGRDLKRALDSALTAIGGGRGGGGRVVQGGGGPASLEQVEVAIEAALRVVTG
jgi:alanyl-tRNA synthetase